MHTRKASGTQLGAVLELPAAERTSLGSMLLAVDVGATLIASLLVLLFGAVIGPRAVDVPPLLLFVSLPVVTITGLTAVGLYQRRKCAITSVEISGIGRVAAAVAVLLLLVLQAADSRTPYETSLLAGTLVFGLLVLGRGWYRQWVKQARGVGRFLTPVALVGDGPTVQRFAERLLANPEGGYAPVAHIDTEPEPRPVTPDIVPRIGHIDDDLDVLRDIGLRSVVVLTPHLRAEDLNRAVRSLQQRFDHVQVVTSLAGVSHSRLVPTPMVDETTFYLEPVVASAWQRTVKRATDIVVSSLLLVVAAPVLAVAAVIVKLTDGGPVLYAQERVGRDGQSIRIRKLRSMVVDAEARTAEVAAVNERGGPLFKATADPRVTRVGRVLRASSIDELPQLWSIIVGDMSLVGPRPALPAEVAEFDDEHRRRHEVRPGLTGLWQVEDRDHPDFERYRRHDVFYIENWSLSLDIAILLQTAAAVISRAARALTRSSDDDGEV